jgi:uncharacterized protein YndB with AHSA1/START domain
MKKEITIVRTLNASPEKVWQAWTDPKQLAQWWSPKGFTTPVVELDPRVGGKLYIVMLGGDGMGPYSGMKAPMGGEFTEVVPNERLAFTNNAMDTDGNALLHGMTSVVFEEVDGKTKMTVTTSAEGDGPNVEMMLGGMEQGWNEQADKLVALFG